MMKMKNVEQFACTRLGWRSRGRWAVRWGWWGGWRTCLRSWRSPSGSSARTCRYPSGKGETNYNSTHFCPPFQHLLSERLTSLGIMGEPRVAPLNPSETIVLSAPTSPASPKPTTCRTLPSSALSVPPFFFNWNTAAFILGKCRTRNCNRVLSKCRTLNKC